MLDGKVGIGKESVIIFWFEGFMVFRLFIEKNRSWDDGPTGAVRYSSRFCFILLRDPRRQKGLQGNRFVDIRLISLNLLSGSIH